MTRKKETTIMPFSWLDKIFEKSALLPNQGEVKVQNLAIRIDAYDPEVFHWIEKYLYPLNLDNALETSLTYSVKLLHADGLVQSVHRLISEFVVDTVPVFTGRRYVDRILLSDDITVDCDPVFGMLWVTDRSSNTIIIVLSTKVCWPLLEVSRVVRDLITRYLADQGWVVFHAGAVRLEDKNYVIIGNSGAGKTSFIIALLSAGAAYIANERVFVKMKEGVVHLLSFPMPIAVGLGTMVQYPELIKFIREPQFLKYPPRRMNTEWIHSHPEHKWSELDDKPQFLAEDLMDSFASKAGVFGGVIDGLIVPSFQKHQPINIESLAKDEALAMVKNNWFDSQNDDIYPPWMPLNFAQASPEEVNGAISGLIALNSIRFQFSADKNRRNEIKGYPELLNSCFKHY